MPEIDPPQLANLVQEMRQRLELPQTGEAGHDLWITVQREMGML
ncbi:hypothetical protein [Leptolyngbya ohadii]|nr:hypothetical protein [Leptolyngbya ohadii]